MNWANEWTSVYGAVWTENLKTSRHSVKGISESDWSIDQLEKSESWSGTERIWNFIWNLIWWALWPSFGWTCWRFSSECLSPWWPPEWLQKKHKNIQIESRYGNEGNESQVETLNSLWQRVKGDELEETREDEPREIERRRSTKEDGRSEEDWRRVKPQWIIKRIAANAFKPPIQSGNLEERSANISEDI